MISDQFPVHVGHFKTIDHHQCSHLYIQPASTKHQHFRKVSVFKKKLARKFIVFFIESSARNKDSNGHGVDVYNTGDNFS
jgi:hypothetical protein